MVSVGPCLGRRNAQVHLKASNVYGGRHIYIQAARFDSTHGCKPDEKGPVPEQLVGRSVILFQIQPNARIYQEFEICWLGLSRGSLRRVPVELFQLR